MMRSQRILTAGSVFDNKVHDRVWLNEIEIISTNFNLYNFENINNFSRKDFLGLTVSDIVLNK